MNEYLEKFAKEKFSQPGRALDLGAGDFTDVRGLKEEGWKGEGVDLKTGVDLEKPFLSKNRPFDLVYSNYVMHKLANRKELVLTAFNNLKSGGWFFLQTFDASDENSSSDLTQDTVSHLLGEAGFTEVSTRVFSVYDSEPGHNHWHKVLEASARRRP